jgi:hypothetical protein
MSSRNEAAPFPGSPGNVSERKARLEADQRRQLVLITAGAIAIFAGLRLLPTGTNLSHMDFRVDPRAGNAIEFCDPSNPQFIPVVSARSPVMMSIVTAERAAPNREVRAVVVLKTGSGKPIEPADLLVTHTRKLHLLVIDPSLADYQHVHPEPTGKSGEWVFSFRPQRTGAYRVFGDFTPTATGRGLYSSVDLEVAGSTPNPTVAGNTSVENLARIAGFSDSAIKEVERDGVTFTLSTLQPSARAGQPIDLRFSMKRADGNPVPLEPVMGAFAHLVAFDEARSGFAHLHPTESDLLKQPDAKNPTLNFKLTIPRAGRYVIWAQVNLGGSETFVPFDFSVVD